MESMKKSDSKWYLTKVKQTIYKFGMIQDGDTVVVGLSGGKTAPFCCTPWSSFAGRPRLNLT